MDPGALFGLLLMVTPVEGEVAAEVVAAEAVSIETLVIPAPEEPVTLRSNTPPLRRLRGDWEAPDVVMVAFTWSWPKSLPSLVRTVARSADVIMVVEKGSGRKAARQWVNRMGLGDSVELVSFQVDTPWVRDYGPMQTQLADGSWHWLDGNYDGRPLDDEAPGKLASHLGLDIERFEFPIDGGALVSNGLGLCVSTLDYFRENDIDYTHVENNERMLQQLGCRTMMLVPALLDEETKHADVMIQFLDPKLALVASVDPEESPEDAQRMDLVAARLKEEAARQGVELTIARIPTPITINGEYISYVNGLRLRDAFLVPQYNRRSLPTDRLALALIAEALPGVAIVPVPARQLVELGGVLHCAALGLALGEHNPVAERRAKRLQQRSRRAKSIRPT